MILQEITQLRPNSKRLKLLFDSAQPVVLYKNEVRRLGLAEGDEISEERYDEMIRDILIPRAKKRALHLLEKCDRTRDNLLRKLREGGYPREVCEQALAYAESYGYIDDRRYAANYVRYHQEKKSRRRIATDLRQKGIDDAVIEAALDEEYISSEREKIAALLEKRNYDPDGADRNDRAKMYRFLMGRGFSSDDIMAMI